MSKLNVLLIIITLFLAIVGCQIWTAYNANLSHFIYPLDDTYIHMAISKNLAESGQWGLTKYEFSSASSSILYTLLLALCFKVGGVSEYVPLIVNLVSAFGILIFVWKIAVREDFDWKTLLTLLFLIIFFTPLPALSISGMEHTLQILINLLFVYYSAKGIEASENKRTSLLFISILASLTVMIRFEGIFLVFLSGSLFFLKKLRFASLSILTAGILPIVLFGIISIHNGSYFVPNSLLIKGQAPILSLYGIIKYSLGWMDVLKINPHLLILFSGLTCSFIYYQRNSERIWSRHSVMTIITGLCIILQITFAKTGWFFRYEAYLVLLSIVTFGWLIDKYIRNYRFQVGHLWTYCAGFLFLTASLYPLIERGKDALFQTVPATRNIFEQQYQMAGFLKMFYNDSEVCLNDIGAASFFSEIKLMDIYGLGSKEITDLKLNGTFDKIGIYRISKQKNIKVAIIYDEWFVGKVPDQWKKAGEWEVGNNVILGGNVVSFYATELYDVNLLRQNLKTFSKYLPPRVVYRLSSNN